MTIINMFVACFILGSVCDAWQDMPSCKKPAPIQHKKKKGGKYLKK